ncbi:hypothetical protein ACVNHC_13045 [Pannonibacter sp. Q-1]
MARNLNRFGKPGDAMRIAGLIMNAAAPASQDQTVLSHPGKLPPLDMKMQTRP